MINDTDFVDEIDFDILKQMDQRFTHRLKTQRRVKLQIEDDKDVLESEITDLSLSGVRIRTKEYPFFMGQKIQMTIFLPRSVFIGLSGRVIWTKEISEKRYAGIHFLNMSPGIQDSISQEYQLPTNQLF